MSKIYAGQITSMRDGVYGDDANAVCNLVVAHAKKAFGGIEVLVNKTVVLFKGNAELAQKTLKTGDRVFFDSVIRNPRIYLSKRGASIETVDMIAESFVKITKSQLKKGLAESSDLMMNEADFTFTDADREALITPEVDDTDIDEVFA